MIYILTDANVFFDPRLHPLDEIPALSATHIQDLSRSARRSPHASIDTIRCWYQRTTVSASRNDRVRLACDQNALDPVVETLEAKNGRVLTLDDADLWTCVVCGVCQERRDQASIGNSQCPAIRPTSLVRLLGGASSGLSSPFSRFLLFRFRSCVPSPPVKDLKASRF